MKIRRATIEDALGIAEVHVKSWRETYKGIISQDYLDTLKVENRLSMWKKILAAPNQQNAPVFVAVNDEQKIVGFSSFGSSRTEKFSTDGELYAIYLLKEYKRKKVGLSLLEEGVAELLNHGYTSMLVWVLEENPSRRFYEVLGAVKVREELDIIDGREHLELAFRWSDLLLLQQKIKSITSE